MKKIGEFLTEMDSLILHKQAFVPASAVTGQGGGGQSPTSGGSPQPQGGQPQQGQPQQGGGQPQQGGGGGEAEQMMQQVMQMLQQAPPEVQQQAQQSLQQIQQMPPEQQVPALQQVAQGVQQMMSQGGGQQSTIGGDPNAQAGGQPGQQPGQEQQAGMANTSGHVRAENELDNKTVTLTIRELMDLTSGGSATKSLLAVKQLADQHNSKMQANAQKLQQDQAKQQAELQAQSQMAQGGGGLYAQAPDMSGKNPQAGQAQPPR